MKSVLKYLLASAILVVAVSAAYADTVTIGSYGTGQSSNGAGNSSLAYLGYNPTTAITTGLGSGTTYNLSNVSPWSSAIPGSSWVSVDPKSTVAGGDVLANGYYTYTSTFQATPGYYTGSIGTFADDTLELFVNGVQIVSFANNTPNGPCAQGGKGPTCEGDPYISLFAGNLGNNNTITIVDWQSNGSASGVDFHGTLAATPEPSSFLLLGTGLAGALGMLRRKLAV